MRSSYQILRRGGGWLFSLEGGVAGVAGVAGERPSSGLFLCLVHSEREDFNY